MIAKIWKKVLVIIVGIACLFNIVSKLATQVSFKDAMDRTVEYVKTVNDGNNNENGENLRFKSKFHL